MLISKQLMTKKIEAYYGSDNPFLNREALWNMLEKMVTFIIRLDEVQNLGRAKNVNSFEFNLRDVFRWCDLMLANQSILELRPEVFLEMLFIQRMRDSQQRQVVLELFNEVFGMSFSPARFPSVHLTDHSVKIGNALIRRINSSQTSFEQPLIRDSLRYLESLVFAVQNKLPCLLVGESGSGKSYALQALSSLLNVRLYEYNMNTTTDATEILGCFEQVEVSRHYSRLLTELVQVLRGFIWRALISNCDASGPANDYSNKRLRVNSIGDTRQSIDQSEIMAAEDGRKRSREVTPRPGAMLPPSCVSQLYSLISYLQKRVIALVNGGSDNGVDILSVVQHCEESLNSVLSCCEEEYIRETKLLLLPAEDILNSIRAIERASKQVSFEWIDGSLIEAIVRGYWVVFDNVNFCNASVLDRLNSLLENNGFLLINECGLVDGKERIIYPHNNFRIFFVMNPAFGEISRAMRNRCVELYFTPVSTFVIREMPSLWDAFDLINVQRVNDLLLVLLILQVYLDVAQVVSVNLLKLNSRYLSRFAALTVEQLERGENYTNSLYVAASNTFPLNLVDEYLQSELFLRRVQGYSRVQLFCTQNHIESKIFLDTWKTSLSSLCNEASDIQIVREAFLLYVLILLAARSQLLPNVLQEWIHLIDDNFGDEQKQLLQPLHFFLEHITKGDTFVVNVIFVYLVFMRSKPNLKQIEVVLSSAVEDQKTAAVANELMALLRESLNMVRSSSPYQQLKTAQSNVLLFMQKSSALRSSHIPLFSNNFDDSLLCSVPELLDQLPLFISLQDPVLTHLHKIVMNQGLMTRSDQCTEVLASLDNSLDQLNRFIHIVPLLTTLSHATAKAVEDCRTQALSRQALGQKSVLEISLLVSKEFVDVSQIPNPVVVASGSVFSPLVQIAMEMVPSKIATEDIICFVQYLLAYMELLHSTRYEDVSQTFNMRLVAFLQIFSSLVARIHNFVSSSSESTFHTTVQKLLADMHIHSNISMDNKLWTLVGRPLMAFRSEAFSCFMEIINELASSHFVYQEPLTPISMYSSLHQPIIVLTAEERRSLVDAVATLFWMSSTQEEGEGVVQLSQIKSVIETALQNGVQRLQGTVDLVDTTFHGSVEVEDAASTLVFAQHSAFDTYELLLHDVVLLDESLKHQVCTLSQIMGSSDSSQFQKSYDEEIKMMVIPPEQLFALRQINWISERGVALEESDKQLCAYRFSYLRYYLENYWSDYLLGYRMLQEDEELQQQTDAYRETLVGSGIILTPYTSVNVSGTVSPLMNIRGSSIRNSRDRIEQLDVFSKLLTSLSEELQGLTQDNQLGHEQKILSSVIRLLLGEQQDCSAEEVESLLQTQLQRALDVSTMRYESLCLVVLPNAVRLLSMLQEVSFNSFLTAVIVSVCWVFCGVLLFNLLLPSSIVDPLLKDFIEGDMIRAMTSNLADLAFLLQYQSLQLNGDIHSSGSNVASEQEALFTTLLKKNQVTLEHLQQGEFKRVCNNSFDQLYSTLYSFGASVFSVSRIYHLLQCLLDHLQICVHTSRIQTSHASVLDSVLSLVHSTFDQLMQSPFTVQGDITIHEVDVATLLKEEQVFQSNNHSFKQSLRRSYAGYRDIIEPIFCSIVQVQHGIRLLSTLVKAVPSQLNLSLGNQSLQYSFLSRFSQFPFCMISADYRMLDSELSTVMNNDLLRNSKHKGLIFRSLLTQLLLYNMTVLKRTTADSAIVHFISHFTDLFNEQREKEAQEKADAEKAIEFRVRNLNIENIKGNEEIMEAAFRQQFPDYQLLFDEEAQAKASAQSVDVAAELVDLNRAVHGEVKGVFSADWRISLDDVGYVCEVIDYLVNAAATHDELTSPVREQIVFLNSCIISAYEDEVRNLVLTDYEKASSLMLLLELKLGKDVTHGRDLSSLLHPSRAYSFHNHSNISEAEHCVSVLLPLKRRVFELLKMYPTHVVLQYIIRLIDNILKLPIVTPLTVLLSGVEVLSRRMHDWEVSAASMVSLADYSRQLSSLIIRWRKLELESWGSFLEEEEQKAAVKSREYFCQFYSMLLPQGRLNESIVRTDDPEVLNVLQAVCSSAGIRPQDLWPLMSSNSRIRLSCGIEPKETDSEDCVAMKAGQVLTAESCDYTHSLIDILDSYLRGSQLLEFSSRLQLLLLLSRFMRLQISQQQLENSMLETNMNILYHTTRMYSVFIPAVKEEISQIKSPIEKQLKDQVKLGKWDDQSYFSLHETVGKIHRQLFKLIYSYRDSNNIKVSVVLDRFLNNELSTDDQEEKPKSDKNPECTVRLLQAKETGEIVDRSRFTSLQSSLSTLEDALHLEEIVSLTRVSGIRHRFSQLLTSSTMEYILGESLPGESLDELAVTIITTAIELRRETKFVIRKQKEFSHLLSHLKENGISYLKATVPVYQQQYDSILRLSIPEIRPIPAIVKKLAPISAALQQDLTTLVSTWSKGDQYYYKDYLLLTSLRLQVSQEVTNQVTAADVRRCLGYTENIMLNMIQEREVILSLSSKMVGIYGNWKHVNRLCDDFRGLNEGHIIVCPGIVEVASELETLYSSNIEILDELLFFAQQMGSDGKLSDHFVELCSETRKTLQMELERLTVRDSSLGYKLFCITNPGLYIHAYRVLGEKIQELKQSIQNRIQLDQFYSAANHWEMTLQKIRAGISAIEVQQCSIEHSELGNMNEEEMKLILQYRSNLVTRLLCVVQGLKKQCDRHHNAESIRYQEMHDSLLQAWMTLSLGSVEQDFEQLLQATVNSSPSSLVMGVYLLYDILPMLQQLLINVFDILLRGVLLNKAMGKLEYVLLKLFKEILKKGFCLPQKEEERQKEQEQEGEAEGTGMGEGEGENDVTDQLESKDQLDGLQSEKPEENQEREEKEADDTGMDVEDDFNGERERIKKEEEEEEKKEKKKDKHHEMGDLDEDDQEVLDEKLWNESEEEESPDENEKIEEDSKQQNERNTDEMTTQEQEAEEKEQSQEGEEKNMEAENEENNEEETEEINDLNEQEYEDNHFKYPEEEEEEFPDDMSIEDSGVEEEIQEENENEIQPEEEEGEIEEEKEEEEEVNEDAESVELQGVGEEEAEDSEQEDQSEQEVDEQEVDEQNNQEVDEQPNEKDTSKEEPPEKKENPIATEGVADDAGQDNVLGEESEKKSSKDQDQDQDQEEEEDNIQQTPRDGKMQEGTESNEENKENEENEEVNPYRNPEKTQKKWEEEYQRLQMIPQEDEEENGLHSNTEEQQQKDEVEKLGAEVKQDHTGQDVLAPSIQDVDFKPLSEEANRVEMEEEGEESQDNPENVQYEKEMKEDMGQDAPEFPEEVAEERDHHDEASAFAKDLLEKVTKQGAGKTVDQSETYGIKTKQDLELQEEQQEEVKLPFVDEDSYLNMDVNELLVSPVDDPTVLSDAASVWKECVASTADLSNRLSEQLRLLMEPTKASKLSGDFKTGKRINMRKVIPFIASNYRKDKIWLRRSKPSQREYQVMLVIDNSESMKQNNAGEVSFKTLALIGNALAQLEVGQIGVMSFGEDVQYIHQLGTPFTSQSGASALTHFSFSQKKTSFEACLQALIAILAQSRLRLSGAAKRAVQIAFLVSDGRIQEGRDRIARLLRDAEENNILVVLLIIDDTRKYCYILYICS